MLMIEEISKDSEDYIDGKVGHRCTIEGDIIEISLEFFILAKNIVKTLDKKGMGYLFRGYVEDLLPALLKNSENFDGLTQLVASVQEEIERKWMKD